MNKLWQTLFICATALFFYTGYNTVSKNSSITEQQYGIPEVKAHIQNLFIENNREPGELFDLVVEVAIREQEYAASHEVFYMGNSQLWFFLSLLRTAIAESLNDEMYEHFIFLRAPSKKYNFNKSATDVVIERGLLGFKGKFPDKEWKLSDILLSVNLSLVGNARFEGESVFDFFLKDYNITPASLELIQNIINEWFKEIQKPEISQELFDEIYQQFADVFSFLTTGVIYQIFMPRDLVGKLVYLAKYGGRFYFDDPNPEHQARYIMEAIEESKKDPSLKTNKYQARILCDLHTMLNPKSDILIFTQVLPSQQKQFDAVCKDFKEFVHKKLLR